VCNNSNSNLLFIIGVDEPNRMFMLIQSIVAGLEEGNPIQIPRMDPKASYHRMWETFHVLCKWPIHSDAPYLDNVYATLVEEINTLPSDQSEDDTTTDSRFDIQMAINLANKYLELAKEIVSDTEGNTNDNDKEEKETENIEEKTISIQEPSTDIDASFNSSDTTAIVPNSSTIDDITTTTAVAAAVATTTDNTTETSNSTPTALRRSTRHKNVSHS
jgi:hypothetical protein